MAESMHPLRTEDRSLGELFGDMTRDISTLMRKEMELAKVETKEELTKAGRAGAMLGAGGAIAYMALLLLSFALAWGLAEAMAAGWAFLIVGAVHAVIAAVLLRQGRTRLAAVNPVPEQTVETLKEDVQWAKARKN